MCSAVTCHLHFWQNDRDLLCAIAVTRWWNGYGYKSQHRKLSLEKKILPPALEPGTFRSRVRRSSHCAIPAPRDGLLCSRSRSHPGLIKTAYDSLDTTFWTAGPFTTKRILIINRHKPKRLLKRLDSCVQGQVSNRGSDTKWIFLRTIFNELLNLLWPNFE